MCGRYVRRTPLQHVIKLFNAAPPPQGLEISPSYNIAPSQNVVAVRRNSDGTREICLLRWGLVPPWADDPAIGNRMINARAETAADKPAFRNAFRRRRCILPADGFYEWKTAARGKQPWFIHPKSERPFGMAGLWEQWERENQVIESCTILTTDANELLLPLHDRMPVILHEADYDLWLDPASSLGQVKGLMRPYPAAEMVSYPVSRDVNTPRKDDPSLVQPVGREIKGKDSPTGLF